ncbi:MAG: hypothetical protein ACK41T_01195 [Pseudobdellovibrio sp.]
MKHSKILKQLTFILCFLLLDLPLALSAPDFIIEIGEDHTINHVKEKVWIENSKILSVVPYGTGVRIKPSSLGKSKIKIDKKEYSVMIIPSGFKSSYKTWEALVRKSPYLDLSFCEQTICLKGDVLNLKQFEDIMKTMDDKQAQLFLKLNVSKKISSEIEKWYESYFRNHEMTPPKIVFDSNPWKAILSSKDENTANNQLAHQVGLFTQENKNKIEISDNVKVSVQFIEVKKSFSQNLGISWPSSYPAQIKHDGVELENNILAEIRASESKGESKVIASPNLICKNGKEADFLAGGEIPIKTFSFKSEGLIWKTYGIRLKIKPQIDPLGQISLQIETEVSTPDASKAIDGIPAMQTSKVSSHFDLTQSKTIILSGLIQNDIAQHKDGLPFLSRIPMLGQLFASKGFQENQTELIILVTPEIYR